VKALFVCLVAPSRDDKGSKPFRHPKKSLLSAEALFIFIKFHKSLSWFS